jgi:GTP-binding protein
MKIPKIVIIGRPNVGKSTLFNRLIGFRRAVTHTTAGVTRDPIEEEVVIGGFRCLLIDTGGFTLEREPLSRQVAARGLTHLEDAAVILFTADTSGLTSEDEELADILRPYTDRVIVLVNKADNERLESVAWTFYETGFQEVLPVCALHNIHIAELLDRLSVRIADALGQGGESDAETAEKDGNAVTVSIVGKPNTGKSTLCNSLLAREQSIVSDIPGTTRDTIIGRFSYRNKEIRIMDTAGIRRKNRITEDLEYYSVNRAIGSIQQADIVLLLIDAEEGLTDQDKKISAQAAKKGKGIIIVVNKWDLMEKITNLDHAFRDRIKFLFPVLDFAPVVFISALLNQGLEELLSTVITVWKQLHKQVKTGSLNKHFSRWTEKTPPPRKNNMTWKAKYIVQGGINPIKFILFVNRREGFPEGYVQYIKNSIRRDFGYSKVPIEIELRE